MKQLDIFILTFLVTGLIVNIIPRFPYLPGDIYLDKIGIPIKLPVFSSLLISALILLLTTMVNR